MTLEVEHVRQEHRHHHLLSKGEQIYNTGVVLFHRTCIIIPKWAQRISQENHLFIGDQDVISRIIYEETFPLTVFPSIYNRHLEEGLTPDTHILHFVCSKGKQHILKHLKTATTPYTADPPTAL